MKAAMKCSLLSGAILHSATAQDNCIRPGDTKWMDCIHANGQYKLGKGTFYIDRHFQLPDGVTIEGSGTETIIEATQKVYNGCGHAAEKGGDPTTRIGFVLGNRNTLKNFKYVAQDDHRWQGYDGAALCGGAVFETPGCADAYCQKYNGKAETIGNHGNSGVSQVSIQNIVIRGKSSGQAPQLAVFITQTPDLRQPSHDISISGIDMDHSWADGINVHGCTYNVDVENNKLAFQGDDNLAVWSAGDCAHDIRFRGNTVSQKYSTNPDKSWGNCVAIYGGGSNIFVEETSCEDTSNGGVKIASTFGGSFSSKSSIVVGNMNTNNNKPDCFQQSEVTAAGGTVNNCPAVKAGNDQCYDPCFVHKSCSKGIGYSADTTSTMGVGWYCLDDVKITPSTATDHCCIHHGCGKGATFDTKALVWRCNDDFPSDITV